MGAVRIQERTIGAGWLAPAELDKHRCDRVLGSRSGEGESGGSVRLPSCPSCQCCRVGTCPPRGPEGEETSGVGVRSWSGMLTLIMLKEDSQPLCGCCLAEQWSCSATVPVCSDHVCLAYDSLLFGPALPHDQPDVYSVPYPAVLRPTAIANSFLRRGSVIECKTHRDQDEQRE